MLCWFDRLQSYTTFALIIVSFTCLSYFPFRLLQLENNFSKNNTTYKFIWYLHTYIHLSCFRSSFDVKQEQAWRWRPKARRFLLLLYFHLYRHRYMIAPCQLIIYYTCMWIRNILEHLRCENRLWLCFVLFDILYDIVHERKSSCFVRLHFYIGRYLSNSCWISLYFEGWMRRMKRRSDVACWDAHWSLKWVVPWEERRILECERRRTNSMLY